MPRLYELPVHSWPPSETEGCRMPIWSRSDSSENLQPAASTVHAAGERPTPSCSWPASFCGRGLRFSNWASWGHQGHEEAKRSLPSWSLAVGNVPRIGAWPVLRLLVSSNSTYGQPVLASVSCHLLFFCPDLQWLLASGATAFHRPEVSRDSCRSSPFRLQRWVVAQPLSGTYHPAIKDTGRNECITYHFKFFVT